jgi:ubiquinone/menaquinone biosynthesis C-methylase UbiE
VAGLCVEGLAARSVLDVGTGTGVFAEAFAGLSLKVTGIDPNANLLRTARGLVGPVTFVEGIAEELPFEDDAFDLAFLGLVLHETDDPVRALREASRVARLRVAVLEWPYRAEEKGPPIEHRLKPERIFDLSERAGFPSVERIALAHVDFYRMTPPP